MGSLSNSALPLYSSISTTRRIPICTTVIVEEEKSLLLMKYTSDAS